MSTAIRDDRDFDVKYRPTTLDEMVGQSSAIEAIRSFGRKIPRALLLYGTTGSGKTTAARIIVHDILGIDKGSLDFKQMNCAMADSTIDMVREIQRSMNGSAMSNTPDAKRVWVLDEVQVLSQTPRAQELLLTTLEDCPAHAQFVLCTTEPKRLKPAIRNRCVSVEFTPIHAAALRTLVERIARAEGIPLTDALVSGVLDFASGCARGVAKAMQKIASIEGEEAQLNALGGGFGEESNEFRLVRDMCLYRGRPSWAVIAKTLQALEDSEPEGMRCMILAAARTALLTSGQGPLCHRVIDLLTIPMDDRRSGKALLAARLWEICHTK